MAGDYEPMELRLNTSADLSALEATKQSYLNLQKTVEKGSEEFKNLAAKISSIDAALQGETASMIKQQEALEALIQTTRKMGGDTFELEANLANVNDAMGNQRKIIPPLDDDVKHLHMSHRQLHMAIHQLAHEVPGLGQALGMLTYGFSGSMVAIIAGGMAIKSYVEGQKELMKFLEEAPKMNDGLTDAIKRTKEAFVEARVEMTLYEDGLARIVNKAETAAQNVQRLAAVHDAQRSAQEKVEDRRKALEVAKVDLLEKDPIAKAEKLLAIEEKYGEAKRRREDADARLKLTEMQRQIGNETGQAAVGQGRLPRLEKAATTLQNEYVIAKKHSDDMANTKKEAEKRLAEIGEKQEQLKAPYDAGPFMGLHGHAKGKHFMTLSALQSYNMLGDEAESQESIIENVNRNKGKEDSRLPEMEVAAKRAKSELDETKKQVEELTGSVLKLGEEFKAESIKLGIEANTRLQEQRITAETKRIELEGKIQGEIDKGLDVAKNEKRIKGLAGQVHTMETTPLPTEELFPTTQLAQAQALARKAQAIQGATHAMDIISNVLDLMAGQQEQVTKMKAQIADLHRAGT